MTKLIFLEALYYYMLVIFLPVLYFLINLFTKKVDIDLSDKKSRIAQVKVVIFGLFFATISAFVLGHTELRNMLFVIIIYLTIAVLITHYWKISYHIITNTMLIIAISRIFGMEYLVLLIIIPIVAVSRVKLKKHTIMQTIAGFLLGLTFLPVSFLLK